MGDPDIQRAVEIIDKKIKSLQEVRNQLAQAFGIIEQGYASSRIPKSVTSPTPSAVPIHGPQIPRKEALAAFLISHGPMSRSDIVKRAGLPEGTVSYCLNDKNFFIQLENGYWDVTDFSRNGFRMRAAQTEQTLPG